MINKFLTVAICSYNRSKRIPPLVNALRSLECQVPFEILFVNNNSRDNTERVLRDLRRIDGVPLRYVNEPAQGIVPARNRALHESRKSDYILFMDDDELPCPGLLTAAIDGLFMEGADCVGGRVTVHFETEQRPGWLGDELLGFLAEVNYGNEPFWITDVATPVWTANVAYRTDLFVDGLKFDDRYNRKGKGSGGGEDYMMFRTLLEQGAKIRYRPDMQVLHFVDSWRLKRRYFLKLHYQSGLKKGLWEKIESERIVFGIPRFLFFQAVEHWIKTIKMVLTREPRHLRQAMNAMHLMGMITGTFLRFKRMQRK